MDPSTGRSQQEPPPRSRTPASRDIMFCHECHEEWYRDEHGIACPQCRSDFTEIIEEDNDPRDHDMFDHGHYDDDNEPMPSLKETPPHLHHLHDPHPWQQDDPEEGDISNLEWRQVGPGRFAVRTTMYRTVSPGASGPIGGFASLLNNLIGGGRSSGRQQNQGNQSGEGQNTPDANNRSGSEPTSGGHRFTYTAGARLYPRDPDHPGPHLATVDELNNVLVGLMAEFGGPPGEDHHHHHFHDQDHDHDHDHGHGLSFSPIMGLLAQMMGPGGRQTGSLVYSQEVLDRIVSQLMEQNAGSNAPGPASQNDINALPRKPMSEEMFGTEGRAECSICMDEVKLEEEVTELPCKHWFHHPCVAAWLGEHDTCPHCRKGITKPSTNENLQSSLSGAAAATPEPSRTMPGAFSVSGEGTSEDPYVVIHSSAQNNAQSNCQRGFADDRNSGSGLGERLR